VVAPPSPPRLVLVLGDQLTESAGALAQADPARDIVVMAEVAEETTYVPHHPRKIALVLAAMRAFATRLRAAGWRVSYTELDDPRSSGSIPGEVLRRAAEHGTDRVLVTQPGEWRLRAALTDLPLTVTVVPDDRFICPPQTFADWARGRKAPRMEMFYRLMRQRTGILMDGDTPAGGSWNFDKENRKRPRPGKHRQPPLWHHPDAATRDVLALVEGRFDAHFGQLHPFGFAVTREQAQASLAHFLHHHLPDFGPEQDAMLRGEPFLHHAVIAPYLNLGLLTPLEVCRSAEAEWRAGRAPIASVEGFVRQILGWREYVRGIYDLHGPGYADQNALGHTRPLPGFFWGAPTRMVCVAAAVSQTRTEAYAHHIQRLMVTGNFALLAGIDPHQVHEWYLAVYADAYEWVEAPNVIGMSQHADGGYLGSKPYVSSGAYIDRMSDYCGTCHYRVQDKTGEGACPFNLLYWHFLDRHRDRFARNPRMVQMYATWDRMDPDRRARVLADAGEWLDRLDAGALV
jgi:deoxyribodipyrimidine photolyase-related protein